MESLNFEVEKNESGEKVFTFVRSLCPELSDALLEITNDEAFYNTDVKMTEGELFQYVDQINMKVESENMDLLPLALFLADCFKVKNEQYEKMSGSGKISFPHLSKIFRLGSKFIAFTPEGEMVGSIVHDAKVEQMQFTQMFKVTGKFTFSDGKSFYQQQKDFYIPFFSGMTQIEDLQVRPMNEKDEKILTERGKLFAKYALKPSFVAYTGTMFINTMYGPMHFNSDGRIMVDHIGGQKNRPNDGMHYYGQQRDKFESIPVELLYLTWPFFDAFSFKAKRWGKAYVRNVSEIKFDDIAFDTLVLDVIKKKMIKSLVLNSNKCFADIISQKSGGCIFLLHGPPGTGKTLTTEATAELLHRPLYSITVGELGTTADVLEHKLSSILEMTENWNAVLLIDECDIFLEKRTDGDVERNAMVGIFLRLLERHTGVLFLTTNRDTSLDEAFESRISINIGYKQLDQNSRSQIWKNLLQSAKVDTLSDEDIQYLSGKKVNGKEINGRQIKSAIRMAQALSHDDNNGYVNKYHFDQIMDYLTGQN